MSTRTEDEDKEDEDLNKGRLSMGGEREAGNDSDNETRCCPLSGF